MQTLMMSSLRDSNGARGRGGEVLTTDQNQSVRSLQDAVKGSRCENEPQPRSASSYEQPTLLYSRMP